MRKRLILTVFALPILVFGCGVGNDEGPKTSDQTVSVLEDSSFSITLTSSTTKNAPLTWYMVDNPSHGTLSGSLPTVFYSPTPDYCGTDSFTFMVSDGYQESNVATVHITVEPVNDPPTETGAEIVTDEDTPSTGVTPWAVDVDIQDSFTFSIIQQPEHGLASVAANQLVYTPDPNFNGSDSFAIRTTDSGGEYVEGTVLVTVNPVNDPPMSTSATIRTSENTLSLGVTPTVTDIDSSEPFTFTILTQPLQGSAYVLSNQLYYQPNPSVSGTDSFTYRAYDSDNASVDGTATVIIGAVNDPPVANGQSVTADEDVSEVITLTASDIDGDELTYTIITQPSHGSLTGIAPNVTYLSDPDYNGTDSFTFQANDGASNSNTAAVNITVNPVNDPPTGTGAEIATEEDTASAGVTPWVLDVDAIDSYTYSILTQPSNGSASVAANQLAYDPAPDFNGSDAFTFRTWDSGGEHVDGTATVVITPVNDPPTETSADITTDEDVLSSGVAPLVIDIDSGESFSFSILTQPARGTAYVQSNLLYYQPAPDIYGSDSFTYRAFDSGGEHVDGTAAVTVAAVNDPPVADSQSVELDEDTAAPVVLTGSDIEGDELSYIVVSAPTYGALTGTPPDVTYTPLTDYNGTDEFTFRVNDGSLDSSPATVRLTVNPVTDTWFVDIDATGTADGHSWTNAFNHPQDAMEAAGSGDEVWVAEGIYTLRSDTDSYLVTMTPGARFYGGFSGVEASLSERNINTHPTTLDGEDTVTVIYGASGSRLDGFTVTGGWLSGMVNEGVNPVVVNSVFENNGLVEGQDGGGIRNVDNANAYIASSTFTHNSRSAIYNGNSSPTIRNCTFDGNLSDSGGAIKNSGPDTLPYIVDSTFTSNVATIDGGAISNSASAPLIENSIFSGNEAGGKGGAITSSNLSAPTVVNTLVAGNTAASSGGALYSLESAIVVINCTIVNNNAVSTSGGIVSEKGHGGGDTVINSILWNNSDQQIYDGPSSKTTVTYSDVQGGYTGEGNIDQDPIFLDPANGGYQLSPVSSCVDSGDNSAVTWSLDLDGNPRIVDGNIDSTTVVDMGAYEYVP